MTDYTIVVTNDLNNTIKFINIVKRMMVPYQSQRKGKEFAATCHCLEGECFDVDMFSLTFSLSSFNAVLYVTFVASLTQC